MSNTTDFMITTLLDVRQIWNINNKTGLKFLPMESYFSTGKGGNPVMFMPFVLSIKNCEIEKIEEIISVFKSCKFTDPEFAILFIYDFDNNSKKTIRASGLFNERVEKIKRKCKTIKWISKLWKKTKKLKHIRLKK